MTKKPMQKRSGKLVVFRARGTQYQIARHRYWTLVLDPGGRQIIGPERKK